MGQVGCLVARFIVAIPQGNVTGIFWANANRHSSPYLAEGDVVFNEQAVEHIVGWYQQCRRVAV